jgi:hypothetical protein
VYILLLLIGATSFLNHFCIPVFKFTICTCTAAFYILGKKSLPNKAHADVFDRVLLLHNYICVYCKQIMYTGHFQSSVPKVIAMGCGTKHSLANQALNNPFLGDFDEPRVLKLLLQFARD